MKALHLASYAGHIACCLFLIRRGADVDALDINDQTPLFRAVMAGRADVVLALIQEGGNPNFRDVNGR